LVELFFHAPRPSSKVESKINLSIFATTKQPSSKFHTNLENFVSQNYLFLQQFSRKYENEHFCFNSAKRKIFIKNKTPPPQENVKGRTKHSRQISMSATAVLTPNRSNWGGRAGGLGFCIIFIFSG
jgi:hypothetical protein